MLLFENKSKLFPGEKHLITMKAENKSGMVIPLWDMYVFEIEFSLTSNHQKCKNTNWKLQI